MPHKSRKRELTDEEYVQAMEKWCYRRAILFGFWGDVDVLFDRVGDTVTKEEFPILVRDVRRKGGGMANEEITLSDETLAMCQRRAEEGCACCIYIVSDFKKHGKLTDYPGNYPVEAKMEHVRAEKGGEVA